MKIFKTMKTLIFLIIFLYVFSACYESESLVIGGKTYVFKLQDSITYHTDTLTLYGENLGLPKDSSYVVINDIDTIKSADCLAWTQSKIQIIVPMLPKESTIYVVANGAKIFYDNENYYQNLIVLPYPAFECALVPAGNFDMGSEEFGFLNEQPIHNVVLTKSIYVSVFEIEQRLYFAVMGENPSTIKYNNYPVYDVKWFDAIQFCNKLSELDELNPAYIIIDSSYISFDTTANGWRLPTEAEWEYFADLKISNETELLQYAWFANNSSLNPHSVGLLQPNKYGLYDVLGNVWEWCWDWYREDYYSVSPIVNPVGPINGTERAIRGGSCDDGKIVVRKEYRTTIKNNTKTGFRIVRNAN